MQVEDDSQMKEDRARRLEDAGETPAFPGGNDSKKKFAPNKRPRDDRPVAPPMGEWIPNERIVHVSLRSRLLTNAIAE